MDRIQRSPRLAWEWGLAASLFASFFPKQKDRIAAHLGSEPMLDVLAHGMNEHATNVEFALIRQLASFLSPDSRALETVPTDTLVRATDEATSAVRWLLREPAGGADFRGNQHYLWSVLKETVLRPTYIGWQDELQQFVDRTAVQRSTFRDIPALLTDVGMD
jgi:hypothetical protein